MSDISYYPSALPAPLKWDMVPRERRARSGIDGKPATRNRQRDRIVDVQAQWLYTPEQMAVWVPWFETTLVLGLCWWYARLPGPGGWQLRVVHYRTETIRREHVAKGIYRISATLEQRGRFQAPPVLPTTLAVVAQVSMRIVSGYTP